MKTLNEYIKESLLSDIDTIDHNGTDIEMVKGFLKNNWEIKGSYKVNVTDDGIIVDANGVMSLKYDAPCIAVGFKFGKIRGSMNISDNDNITNLDGAPREITRAFKISKLNNLKSLEGFPDKANDLYIVGCNSLKDLVGCPKEVWGFSCVGCKGLHNLKGCPQSVEQVFNCSNCTSLTSLEGAPKEAHDFRCNECHSLKNLEGAPKKITKRFECMSCDNLKSLKGIENTVIDGEFNCSDCQSLHDFTYVPKRCTKMIDSKIVTLTHGIFD